MARPTNKAQLLEAVDTEFVRLLDLADSVDPAARVEPGACDEWSVKDLLAHLDAWHRMFLSWEEAGRGGVVAPKPAEGFAWSDTPVLNARIHAETADDTWDEVWERLDDSHARIRAVIDRYTTEELFGRQRFEWTGSTSLAVYAGAATASHYSWATKLIRRWLKSGKGRVRTAR